MKKSKKVLPAVLATAVTAVPFLQAPEAYAITNVSIDADDTEAGKESEYTIEFKIEEDLKRGDNIYIEFESYFDVDEKIDENDVEVNGEEPDKVTVDDGLLEIEVDESFDAGDTIEVVISDGITNPDSDGDYDIWVWTDGDDNDEYGTIEIEEDEDDDDDNDNDVVEDAFTVKLGDTAAGKVTSYLIEEFDLKSRSDDLQEGEEIVITFPDADMLPDEDDVDTDDVEINGYEVESIEIDGDEVTLEIPEDADGDDSLEIEFSSGFGITNPDVDDDYTITVEYDGYEYESEPFKTTDGGTTTPAGPFTVKPGTTTAGARSSYTIEADFGSKKLDKNEVVKIEFPNSAMLPGFFNTSKIKVNGKTVRKAFSNGKYVYLTVSSSLKSSSSVKVVFDYDAGLKNPTQAGQYQVKMTVDGKTLTSQKFTVTAKKSTGAAATPAKATGIQP